MLEYCNQYLYSSTVIIDPPTVICFNNTSNTRISSSTPATVVESSISVDNESLATSEMISFDKSSVAVSKKPAFLNVFLIVVSLTDCHADSIQNMESSAVIVM